MKLTDLPDEIHRLIAAELEFSLHPFDYETDLNALTQVNKYFYSLFNDTLYQHNISDTNTAIRFAVTHNLPTALQRCLTLNAPTDTQPPFTPPHWEEGMPDRIADDDELSLLCLAIRHKYTEVLNVLLTHGFNANCNIYWCKVKPWRLCIAPGYMSIFTTLVQAGLDPNHPYDYPLFYALKTNDLDIVKTVLDAGADLDLYEREDYRSALRIAVEGGNAQLVKFLLGRGLKLTSASAKGASVLETAAWHGHMHLVRLFLEMRTEKGVEGPEEQEAFICAAGMGHVDVVRTFLEFGTRADVPCPQRNRPNAPYSETALRRAVNLRHLAVVEALIASGQVDVNRHRRDGSWPLAIAAAVEGDGGIEVLRAVLEAGADPCAVDDSGWSALRWAAMLGAVEVVRLLVDKGAVVDQVDGDGRTPLGWVMGFGPPEEDMPFPEDHPGVEVCREVAKMLLENGADVNHVDSEGFTVLIRAAAKVKDCHEIVQLLLDHGADVDLTDSAGDTAVSWAERKGNAEVVKVLRQHSNSQSADM